MNWISATLPDDGNLGESLLTDILLRIYVAGAVVFFAVAAFNQWQADPSRITLLLVAIIETITATIIVCSRRAQMRDWRPLSLLCAVVSMFYFLALSLVPGGHLIPELAGAAIQIAGLAVQLFAKLSLGRSFGVLPARRGLVTRGAYRWVRHPIYLGYLISHVGFLLTNFSLRNAAVLGVLYLVQIIRIQREELMLTGLPGYFSYRDKVRYRLIPGVF